MKVGLDINRFDWPNQPNSISEHVSNLAKRADAAKFDSLWVMDHFFQIGGLGPAEDPMLEAYTTLGYMAGLTNHVRLGTMVTGNTYREPALLIKAVTALDVLSGGRAYFAIGAGWNQEEAEALGLNPPLNNKRFERLEDTLKLAKQMFTEDQKAFQGEVYTVPRPMNHPQPLSKPHPPILIGGGGEQRTLRLVAQYADACNLFARSGTDILTRKLDVLRKHCEAVGRNYDEIEKTAQAGFTLQEAAESPDNVIQQARELAKHGISHLIYANGTTTDMSVFDTWEQKILPELRQL